jgi:hypothetical protein
MSDKSKEIMTQEDIDAYISSVRAGEQQEKAQDQPLSQHAGAEKMEDEPAEVGDAGLISQDDIDAMIGLSHQGVGDNVPAVEQAPDPVPVQAEFTGSVSQSDIDALLNMSQQVGEDNGNSSVHRKIGAVLQEDIDALLNQQQTEQGKYRAGINDIDPGSNVQAQNKANEDGGKKVWEKLDQNILSQEEIDALMSGFLKVESESSSAIEAEAACVGHSENIPDRVDDSSIINRNEYEERLRRREEYIIGRKQKAAAMIQKILRSEDVRINSIMAIKGKIVNENLFARYEIIRSDRTKMIVSMSDNAIKEYRQMHPDYFIYRN